MGAPVNVGGIRRVAVRVLSGLLALYFLSAFVFFMLLGGYRYPWVWAALVPGYYMSRYAITGSMGFRKQRAESPEITAGDDSRRSP